MKFNETRSKVSGYMERHESVTDGMTDEGHSYDPLLLRGVHGIKKLSTWNKTEK